MNFLEWLSSIEYGNVFLLILRIGVLITILGLFMLPKKSKTKLKKIVETQQHGTMESTNPIVRFAERTMDRKFFKPLKIKEKDENGQLTKEYKEVQAKITSAGGLHNATPQTIQFFRIILPMAIAIIGLVIYFSNYTYERTKVIRETRLEQQAHSIDDIEGVNNLLSEFVGNSATSTTLQTVEIPKVNYMVIMWIIVISLVGYVIPDFYLKNLVKKRAEQMRKEIPTFRTFSVAMLETKTYPIYNILKILVGSTNVLKEPIMECQNEYYVDAKKAINKLSTKIDDEEFHIVCNALAQAVDEDKETTLMFLRQQLSQYDTMKHLKEQEKIKKKPNLFVMVLAIPLVSILIIWFYPWFLDAMKVLGSL